MVRYVAYRDRAAPHGRLFDRERTAGDRDRLDFLRYVRDSTRGLNPKRSTPYRAVYRLVISPADARGVDLRSLTRQTLAQLDRDIGPGRQLRWIAAEHHNTAHPHVHVVLAARRERETGGFRSVVITRERLGRMKEAMTFELQRQRGERQPRLTLDERLRDLVRHDGPSQRREAWRARSVRPRPLSRGLQRGLRRLAGRYRREAEELEREELQRDRGRER